MAYEAHEWDVGEVITAEKLNTLEQAVSDAGGGLVVDIEMTDDDDGDDGDLTPA